MKVPFQTVDVFTDRQFGGNPCGRHFRRARPFGRSNAGHRERVQSCGDNVCVASGRSRQYGYRTHFHPARSDAVAGHPNVGTAFVLAHQDAVCGASYDRRNMIFEEIAELVRMRIDSVDDRVTGASLAAPQHFRVIRNFDVPIWSRKRARLTRSISGCAGTRHVSPVAARPSSLLKCATEHRYAGPSSAWTSSCRTCPETRSLAFISMSRMQKRARTFNRGVCAAAWRL